MARLIQVLVYMSILTYIGAAIDEAPLVEYSPQSITVLENQAPQSVGIEWNATDPEGDINLVWALEAPSTYHSYFDLDTTTGNLTLIVAVDLEDDATFPDAKLTLGISVADNTGNTTTLTIDVFITDVNEFSPIFSDSELSGRITENSPNGTEVMDLDGVAPLNITATDADRLTMGNVSYAVTSPNDAFDIFSVTLDGGVAVIEVTGNLDREQFPTSLIVVEIQAMDSGTPPLTDVITVRILIEDENDNTPDFAQSLYTFAVRSDAGIGAKVGMVEAVDPDLLGRPITYTMVNNATVPFFVDYVTGWIIVNTQTDLNVGDVYTLWAYAGDADSTHQSGATQVDIAVLQAHLILSDWEIDPNGVDVDLSFITEFEQNLQTDSGCVPCDVEVVKWDETNSGTWVFQVYIKKTDQSDASISTYMTVEEVLAIYTSDGQPTPEAEATAPSPATVIRIEQSVASPDWWTHTTAGAILITLICLFLVTSIAGVATALLDIFWWSRRTKVNPSK